MWEITATPVPQARAVVVVGRLMDKSPAKLSVIVPVLNEAKNLADFLRPLQAYRGQQCEVIVVDGGSSDDTVAIAEPLADYVLRSSPGRAQQMNQGAEVARGQYLLFLHGDTFVGLGQLISQLATHQPLWGFFKVRLSGGGAALRLVERLINWRSAITRVATGDQGIFVRRSVFSRRQFPEYPLMEDVAFSKVLRRLAKPMIIAEPALTSSRRWEQNGVIKTVVLMWWLRLAFFIGVNPDTLHGWYYGKPEASLGKGSV